MLTFIDYLECSEPGGALPLCFCVVILTSYALNNFSTKTDPVFSINTIIFLVVIATLFYFYWLETHGRKGEAKEEIGSGKDLHKILLICNVFFCNLQRVTLVVQFLNLGRESL